MFGSDVARDDSSRKMTRRVFVCGGVAALSYAGWVALHPKADPNANLVHGTPGMVAVAKFGNDGTPLGVETLPKVVKSDGEWLKQLGANSFDIARRADTETPFFGAALREHRRGMFRCVCCGTALFSSATKFESGTGWPSFWQPVAKGNVVEVADGSLGVERTEVKCVRCEAHLGHVFNDGPAPTGLRYCMNSASLVFGVA